MSRNPDAKPAPWAPASPSGRVDAAKSSAASARDDAVALLRVAGLDAELDRLRRSRAGILEPLERRRSDGAALGELIAKDGLQGTGPPTTEGVHAQRPLLRNRRAFGDLATALKRDEAGVLALSRDMDGKIADFADQRGSVLARVSACLAVRYEAALRKGRRPALAAVRDGRGPGCGEAVPEDTRRLVGEKLCVVPCPGCLRLLYDRGWTERHLMPRTLRPVARDEP